MTCIRIGQENCRTKKEQNVAHDIKAICSCIHSFATTNKIDKSKWNFLPHFIIAKHTFRMVLNVKQRKAKRKIILSAINGQLQLTIITAIATLDFSR